MIELQARTPINATGSAAKAWLRALELTAPIPRNRDRVMSTVIEELATCSGDAPALLSDRECLTYRGLAGRSNQYARWALEQGLDKGEVVGLLMTNRPEYFAIWLGITSVGGVVALLNTNLVGPSLAHCINIISPKHLIAAGEFVDPLSGALPSLTVSPVIWTHGVENAPYERIDLDVERKPGGIQSGEERRPLSIEDRALYIFTSGTTGLPKAANVSHARVMQWSHWFAGMMGAGQTDRMYNCLPMYHSIGGVLAPGATLVSGGAVVIREKFSASGENPHSCAFTELSP
jgi:fatty-acyl-CoA synthase